LAFLSLNIPSDVKRKIYDEYFKEAIIYNKKYCVLMRQVESMKGISLNPITLGPIIELLIQTPYFVAYVRAKNDLFRMLYENHYIKGQKNFIQMDMFTSLTATWLLYHHY
jgi:hypothetical protein